MSQRVLFIIGTGSIGGREGQLLNLAKNLAAAGWHPGVVFLVKGGPIADSLRDAGVSIWLPVDRTISEPRRRTLLRGCWRRVRLARALVGSVSAVRRATREHRPDVVHAMLPASVWLGLPSLAGIRPRPRRVAGIYGFTDTMRSPLQVLYRRQLRCADAVVCNAPHLAQEAIDRHHAPSSRTSVIANGVDTSARSTPVDTQPPTAVVVANFHAYKGHADLLHALALVPETVEVFVRLCGTGRGRDEMRELAKTLGVDARVVFVEPPADISAELRHAQFAIHPSHTEGMSNAILEELGAGLPVIACNVGGNPGLISSEVNGLLVPASDPVALAAAVTRMVLDPVLRGQMSQMARASAEQHSWPACTQAHIELYSEVCARAER